MLGCSHTRGFKSRQHRHDHRRQPGRCWMKLFIVSLLCVTALFTVYRPSTAFLVWVSSLFVVYPCRTTYRTSIHCPAWLLHSHLRSMRLLNRAFGTCVVPCFHESPRRVLKQRGRKTVFCAVSWSVDQSQNPSTNLLHISLLARISLFFSSGTHRLR